MYDSPPDPNCDQIGSMFRDYQSEVHNAIRKRTNCSTEQAEDLTEEVFLRAYRSLKGGSGPTSSTRGWLLKIAENICNRFMEQSSKHPTVSFDRSMNVHGKEESFTDRIADDDDGPELLMERRESLKELEEALNTLPPDIRQAVVLYYLDGLTRIEIARQIHRTSKTVGGYVKKGIELLRERLIQE